MEEGKKQKSHIIVDAYIFVVLTLVSFLLLYFSNSSFILNFKELGLSLFFGSRNIIYVVSSTVTQTINSVQELARLRQDYADLLERVARYEREERTSAEIRQENRRLREQLDFAERLEYVSIAAQITGRDPDNLFSAFAINKGSRSQITNDMPVVAYQGGIQGLIGKVIRAGHFESLVMPVYDVSSFVPARFAEARYEGIVEGQGSVDSPLLMRFIPKRARDEISIGDIIITSGIGGRSGIYAPGITIGRVSRILYQENEISMAVELESVIDFSRLEHVFVVDSHTLKEEREELEAATENDD